MLLEFFRRVDGAQDFMKQFVRRLDLPADLVKPFVWDMTVGTFGSDARPVLEMNSLLQLLVYVIPHFVAGNAELLGIRHLHRPVESAPEQDAADATGNQQSRQRKARSGRCGKGPDTRNETSLRSRIAWIAQGSTIPRSRP